MHHEFKRVTSLPIIILTGKSLITTLQLIPSLLFGTVMSIFFWNNSTHGYATESEKIYSLSLNIGQVYNHVSQMEHPI